MKRVTCPKCKEQSLIDIPSTKEETIIPFTCPHCQHKFRIRIAATPVEKEESSTETDKEEMAFGYITTVENKFGFQQTFPLKEGDNVIGRKNKDTDGVDIAIVTSDPSMGRKHCVIHVKRNSQGSWVYTLRDFPSLTGTFLGNEILEDKDRIQIDNEAVVTIGATTFILHAAVENNAKD